MSRPPRDIAEWMKLMEQKVMQANRSGQAALARQLQAEIIKVRDDMPGAADTRTPAAPIELTFGSALYVDENSKTHAEINIDFPPVTVATDASALVVDRYELWGRRITTWNGQGAGPAWLKITESAGSEFLSRPWMVNHTYQFKVRAIGVTTALPGVFSAIMELTTGADTTPPKILPNPVLSQSLGVVMLAWDGLAADDTAMDPDFSHAEIAYGAASAPTAIYPQVLTSKSTIPIPNLPYGEPRYFRMRSVDHSGNASVWSGDSAITRQPLVSGDISGLDATIQAQTDRAESAENAALQAQEDADTAAANAVTAATNAANSATAAEAAAADAAATQSAADQVAAEAALVQAAADQAAADAAAAEAAAAQSAADALAAQQAAADSATAAQNAESELQAMLGEGGRIIRGDTEPAVEDRLPNNVWLKSDGSMWVWDETGQAWTPQTNQAMIDLGLQIDTAEDAAVAAEAAAAQSASEAAAAEAAATTAQANAAASASTATAAQTAATNAQNAANASAQTANEAQAEAEAAAQAAIASQTAAEAAQAASEQAAIDAGSSSAAALAAEEAAEAANLAADEAVALVDSYIRSGDNMAVNGEFDLPIQSPPVGWPTRTLTYNEVSAGTARTGTQILRASPSTGSAAFAYTDWMPGSNGRTYYVEYYARRKEATIAANTNIQLGAGFSWTKVDGSTSSSMQYQNNGAAAVTIGMLSTTAWTKIAVTYTTNTADITLMRFGPHIPALVTAGQNFELDSFRAIDITEAKAALDAAAAAQSTANTANTAAGAAQSTATSALTAANGNAKLLFSVDPPSGTAPYGTIWFEVDGTGKVENQWQQTAAGTGSTWTKREIRSEVIANLDVGKLVGGFIDATHIETRSLLVGAGPETLGDSIDAADDAKAKVDLWAAAADNTFIDGGKIFTGSVSALQINVNDLFADSGTIGQLNSRIGTFLTNDDGLGYTSTVTGQGLKVTYTDPDTGDVENRVTVGTFTSDFISVSDSAGTISAAMSDEGQVTGREVAADNALFYKGDELDTYLGSYSKGVDVSVFKPDSGIRTNITNASWWRVVGGTFVAKPGRNYKAVFQGMHVYSTVAGDKVNVKMSYARNAAPTSTTPPTDSCLVYMPAANSAATTPPLQAMGTFNPSSVEEDITIVVWIRRETGTGTVSYNTYANDPNYWKALRLWVEDMGPDVPETGAHYLEQGASPPATPAIPSKITRTTEWAFTGNSGHPRVKSFTGSDTYYAYNTSKGYQGLSPAGYGNLKSLYTFPTTLSSTISGSTINGIWVYFYFEHWYYNSGGKARIVLHGNTLQPTTYGHTAPADPNTIVSTGWPKGAGRWVAIPSTYWNGFRDGTYKGVGLYGDGTYLTYGIANNCRIRVKYTK